jgi:hypothetical protein
MLLACNVFDILHSEAYFEYKYETVTDDNCCFFIVDTDDYIVQPISNNKLKHYLKLAYETGKGLEVCNVGYDSVIDSLYIEETPYDLGEYITSVGKVDSDLGITFKCINENNFLLLFSEGTKYDLYMDFDVDKSIFQFKINDILVCSIHMQNLINIPTLHINYALFFKGYFLVFTALKETSEEGLGIGTHCVVLGFKTGKLTDIIFDCDSTHLKNTNKDYATEECSSILRLLKTKMKVIGK